MNNFIVKYDALTAKLINLDVDNGPSHLSENCNKANSISLNCTYNAITGVLTVPGGNVGVNDGFCYSQALVSNPQVFLVKGKIKTI